MSRALLATALGTGVLAVGFHTAWTACRTVSYTHLTLPTIYSV